MSFPAGWLRAGRLRVLALVVAVSGGILAMHGLGPMVSHSATMTSMQHTSAVRHVTDTTAASDHDMTGNDDVGEVCIWVLVAMGALATLALLARRRSRLHSSASLDRTNCSTTASAPLASARAGPMPVLLC